MNQDAINAEIQLRRRYARLRKRQALATAPLGEFITTISPHYVNPTHLKPMVDALANESGEPLRLIVTVPPRHSKSESLLHYSAQLLARDPRQRIAYASYEQTFSETQAIKAHRYAQLAGVTPNPNMRSRKDWHTKDGNGGGIFATSIGGGFTGRGADLIIIDDPVSNPEQANSPTYRNRAWDWFDMVAETRLEPGGGIVLIMTRWHPDDLAGRLIEHRPEFKVIRIPALADGLDALGKNPAPDPLGRAEGEALWPERYPAEQLRKLQEQKPYSFASLYQGLPRAPGDQVFGDAAHYPELPSSFRTIIGTDVAFSKKNYANSSAVIVYAVHAGRWYIRHAEKWRESISGTITRLQRIQKTYGGRLSVEANGPQLAVFDLLADKGLPVNPIHRSSDKYAEAQSLAEAWAAGRILLPDPATKPVPWYGMLIEEFTNFTGINDAEDDLVDAAVNGFEDDTPARPDARATLGALKAVRRGRK